MKRDLCIKLALMGVITGLTFYNVRLQVLLNKSMSQTERALKECEKAQDLCRDFQRIA
jgi:hypothetical protein